MHAAVTSVKQNRPLRSQIGRLIQPRERVGIASSRMIPENTWTVIMFCGSIVSFFLGAEIIRRIFFLNVRRVEYDVLLSFGVNWLWPNI